MRFLGIDYGANNVGVAISDDEGKVAFPKVVLTNDKHLTEEVAKLCTEEKITHIILGASLDFSGKENPIMEDIKKFKNLLESWSFKVYLEPEFMSSQQARRIDTSNKNVDARAAAIILQGYLDKTHD